MNVPPKPLSMKPDAIRQRRLVERRRLEREAAELAGTAPPRGRGRPKKETATQDGAVLGATIPIHTTKTVNIGGADRFAAPPTVQSSDGSFLPLVPSPSGGEPPSEPSDDTSQSGAPGATAAPQTPAPSPGTITPEEAKLFGAALKQYFEFGCSMLLAKRPEFANGIIQISGTPQDFQKNFAIAAVLVGGCGERVALKYNLRIPYLDEAVVVGSIGLATLGLFGKPSKAGAEMIKNAQEQARAQQARNANPAAQPPSTPPAPNGKSSAPISPEVASSVGTQPINTEAAGGMELD